MAVRHDVENLIRRGNIFYWRARIPHSFTRCTPGSRLSLSLQVSDHKKAQMVARHLNMRLAEMKLKPKEIMADREQLQKLFERVRNAMLEDLDDVNVLAKRKGRAGHVREMELDLEAGWAYNLMAKFGAAKDLTLAGDCTGLSFLLRSGVPISHVDAIRANHVAGLKMVRSPDVQEAVRGLMVTFGIPDTPLNRERAMTKFCEARAEALFDIDERHELVDRSLSTLPVGGRTDNGVREPVELAPLAVAPLTRTQEVNTEIQPERARQQEPDVAHLDLTPRAKQPTEDTKPPDDRSARKFLPVHDFEMQCDKLIANKGKEWEPATARDAMALVRMLKSVLEEHNVEHSGQINQYHMGEFRQHFNQIPTNWGKSPRMRTMTAPELRAEGHRMREEAKAEGRKANVGLSAGTIRKHLGNLDHFLKHLRGHGYEILDWTFEGLRPRKPKAGEIRLQQYKPKPEDIAPIFSSPVYVGSHDHLRGKRRKPGAQVFHDSLYYLPILFTYLGPRRKEFAGLAVSDIARDEHGYVIIIRTNNLRRLKNVQSERWLPLPDELVRLGFIDYCRAIKKLGYEALFPDLFSHKTDNDPGDRFYDAFVPILKGALGTKMWDRAIHALRHGMADTLKQAGVPTEVIDDISGRLSEGSETNTRYTNPAGLALMRSALKHYPIITSIVEPKPLQLLPWVENKQPPPWAREGKKQNQPTVRK